MNQSIVLGFFDGVHIGHRAVINSAIEYNKSGKNILVTLKESPALYFGKSFEYIMPRKDSISIIQSLGIDEIVELDFNKIAKMTAIEYIEFLINKYNPISISTGFNHTFGYNKQGNAEFLALNQIKYGYKYLCTEPLIVNNEIVSSSLIRNLIKEGNIKSANDLLQSNFSLEGTVIHGKQIGRAMGFPTANIKYPANIVKMPYGVYSARVNNYKAILNWGIKPTLNHDLEPIVEVHILNFNDDLYGKNLRIEILKQLRGERKFSNLEELKMQIIKDIQAC